MARSLTIDVMRINSWHETSKGKSRERWVRRLNQWLGQKVWQWGKVVTVWMYFESRANNTC